MNQVLLECIPNFSEGRDTHLIQQITDEIESVDDVELLHVDPGFSANRTVVTFVGEPEAVIEAAFLSIGKAAELIDMSKHKGTHPRMGATDVCPLVPISGISTKKALQLAETLARRVGEELQIPVYLYEKSARVPDRRNLATIRSGEYEGFKKKIYLPGWKPDYGPQEFNTSAGQTVIGVRDFLIAYNINLNTRSVKKANAVAFDIREQGRIKKENGKPVLDEKGQVLRVPGACKAVKAIGWYIEEYGIAQVSTNLTDITQTPLHIAFEATRKSARERGLRVTGSELIGMIPKNCLIETGRFYLEKQGLPTDASESELIHIAVKSLGLYDLAPFDPTEKVIEYRMEAGSKSKP